MTVHGTTDADAAIALICGPWDWWEHGRITDYTTNPDGSSDQMLSPVWWFITRVGLHIFPPVNLPDLKGRRVPLRLTHHFSGPSSMDVYPNEQGDAIMIRGRFHGVDYHVPAIPNGVAEGLHLDAESGTMPVPFPKGTGWVGLLHKLEPPSFCSARVSHTSAACGISQSADLARPNDETPGCVSHEIKRIAGNERQNLFIRRCAQN